MKKMKYCIYSEVKPQWSLQGKTQMWEWPTGQSRRKKKRVNFGWLIIGAAQLDPPRGKKAKKKKRKKKSPQPKWETVPMYVKRWSKNSLKK